MAVDGDAILFEIERRALPYRRDRRLVAEVDPFLPRLPRNRAVHRARVDVPVSEARRDRARDRPLSGAGRAVDGDDQGLLAHAAIIPCIRKMWLSPLLAKKGGCPFFAKNGGCPLFSWHAGLAAGSRRRSSGRGRRCSDAHLPT